MSGFKRATEVLDETEAKVSSSDAPLSRADLKSLLETLREVEPDIISKKASAQRTDSPLNERTKAKAIAAAAQLDSLIQIVSSRLVESKEQQPVEVAAPEPVPNQQMQLSATPLNVEASRDDRRAAIAEKEEAVRRELALRKIQEMEAKEMETSKARVAVAAEKEREIRRVQRAREMEEKKKVREEKDRNDRLLASFVRFGQVNHVHGTEDYRNKMRAAGKRAVIIDWFAPWCGRESYRKNRHSPIPILTPLSHPICIQQKREFSFLYHNFREILCPSNICKKTFEIQVPNDRAHVRRAGKDVSRKCVSEHRHRGRGEQTTVWVQRRACVSHI